MLTCKEFVGWLNEYLDQTAVAEIRKHVEEHIECCPECHVVFDTTKKTISVFRGNCEENLPPDVRGRLMAAIEKRVAQGN